MKKQWKNKAKFSFLLFGISVILVVGVLVFVVLNVSSNSNEIINIESGSTIYDKSSIPYINNVKGTVIKSWTNDYVFKAEDDSKISLGKNSIITNSSHLYIFGGGYSIKGDASVEKIAGFYDTNLSEVQFFKLADRKYLIVSPSIVDGDESFEAKQFVYVLIDRQGNAQLINSDISTKTQGPMTLYFDDYSFDIANELFMNGEDVLVDMKTVIGTTNEFNPTTYVDPNSDESALNPEEVNIDVKGGQGGQGGKGGQGGQGGKGSNAEQSDIIKEIMLLGVDRGSTYLNVSYHASDPFAQYGLIYLALYDGSLDLTNPENHVKYLEGQMYGVNTYNTQMTFFNLQPDHVYQIVIGHIIEDENDWYIDDIIKTSTLSVENKVTLVSQTVDTLNVHVKLDKYYNNYPYGRIEVWNNTIVRDEVSCRYESNRLNDDSNTFSTASAVSNNGLTIPISYSRDASKQSSVLTFVVRLSPSPEFKRDDVSTDDINEDETIQILSMTTNNGYYDGTTCNILYTINFYDGFTSLRPLDTENIKTLHIEYNRQMTFPPKLDPSYFGETYNFGWGLSFKGWRFGEDSNDYQPNEQIVVVKDTQVKASWECPANATLGDHQCVCMTGYVPQTVGSTYACILEE